MKKGTPLQKAAKIFQKHKKSLLPYLPLGHDDLWVSRVN